MNCGIEVEANDLIILLNERIIHETNQIKELLQYNDKMKFDKWLKQKHLEIRVSSWICERKLLPISPNFEIVNNLEANEAIVNENDILIINEQIESSNFYILHSNLNELIGILEDGAHICLKQLKRVKRSS
jgi:hypothetical protein